MDWQLVASYFTGKSTDIFCSVFGCHGASKLRTIIIFIVSLDSLYISIKYFAILVGIFMIRMSRLILCLCLFSPVCYFKAIECTSNL